MTIFAGMNPFRAMKPQKRILTLKETGIVVKKIRFSMPRRYSFWYPSQNAGPCTAFMLKNANFAGLTPPIWAIKPHKRALIF